MLIGALQRFSLIDYPGRISCIVFTQGCNFRCPFCHNPELVNPDLFTPTLMPGILFDFLEKRVRKLDAVVITGGEPTIHADLAEIIQEIKHLGFLVKLDTNGSHPEILESLIERRLVDYIAMDIKAPLRLYDRACGVPMQERLRQAIRQSIRLIIDSGIRHEFRTTIVRDLLHKAHILEIASLVRGANSYVLQNFVPSKTLDRSFLDYSPFEQNDLDELMGRMKELQVSCTVR